MIWNLLVHQGQHPLVQVLPLKCQAEHFDLPHRLAGGDGDRPVGEGVQVGAGGGGGALTGTADGFMGPITVEVTMDGDTITSVTVVDNSETLNIASGALEQIPEAIVAANSPDVDVVAGATYTSNGIMNAVKDAIGAAE